MKQRYDFLRVRAGDAWEQNGRTILLAAGLLLLVVVIAVYLASCNVPTVPPEAPITRAPSLTPSATATETEQPTHIPTRTLTWTPSWTPTTVPPTLTPTYTSTATATPEPSATATASLTPSFSPSPAPTLPTIEPGRTQITPTLPETGENFEGSVNHLGTGKGAFVVCDEGNPFALMSGNTILIGCNKAAPGD